MNQVPKDKVIKFAENLNELIPQDVKSLQNIYEHLKDIFISQREYFNMILTPELYIKIILYIFSYRKFNDFEGGQRLYDNLFFANIFSTTGNFAMETCNDCDGDGDVDCEECGSSGFVRCSNCYGEGEERCNNCEGKGSFDCEDCDGSGELEDGETCGNCNGSGDVKCDNCNGEGDVQCEYCDGSGDERCEECNSYGKRTCDNCNGDGEIESDENYEVDLYCICSFDKNLKNLCEIRKNTTEPIMEIEDLTSKPNVLILRIFDKEAKSPKFELTPDMAYCFEFETSDIDMGVAINHKMQLTFVYEPEFYFN
jgi:hypothetical protein